MWSDAFHPTTFFLERIIRSISFAGRQHSRFERFFSELALHGLDARELERLTCYLYDVKGTYKETGIFPWEEAWFRKDLPPAPARILVGGAGTGREVRYLHTLGYDVVAFEPAPSLVLRAKVLDPQAFLAFLQGSYEDLVDPVRPRHADLNHQLQQFAPFDAVLLGWGSFSHVVDPGVREGIFRRIRELSPTGPALASFFLLPTELEPANGRMERWGRQTGRWLRKVGNRQENLVNSGDLILFHAGFGHWFTPIEIESLAEQTGNDLIPAEGWPHPHEYPHCTFVPRPAN